MRISCGSKNEDRSGAVLISFYCLIQFHVSAFYIAAPVSSVPAFSQRIYENAFLILVHMLL